MSEKMQFTLIGLGVVVVGISGWVLPYRWNLLRLKRGVAHFFSDKTNERIPRITGTVFILLGLALVVAAATGKLDSDRDQPTPPAAVRE